MSFLDFIEINLKKVSFYIPFYISNTVLNNINCRNSSILDVGCGWGEPMKIHKREKNYKVGIDIFLPYLIQARSRKTHDEYILCDIKDLPFKEKSFDIVLILEVIEHLEKDDAIRLIKELEKIARIKVIVTTPVGFWPDSGRDDNPYQIHKSGFLPNEFRKIGYNVRSYGINKIDLICSNNIYINKKIIKRVLRVIFSPLSYYVPILGERMICIKNIENQKKPS